MAQHSRRIFRALGLPALEQLTASFGSFIFMLLGARLLDVGNFGIIALLWSIIQFPAAVFFALVLLPIAASNDQVINRADVIKHALSVLCYITVIFAVFSPAFLMFSSGDDSGVSLEKLPLLVLWNTLQLSFELVRWTIIRYGRVSEAFYASCLRWAGFLGAITFFRFAYNQDLGYELYLLLNLVCLGVWIGYGVLSLRAPFGDIRLTPKYSGAQVRSAAPLLVSSIASAAANYILVAVIVRCFSLEALGALQAYRSVANIFSTLSQFIDNHVTAYLVRAGRQLELGSGLISGIVSACVGSYVIGVFLEDTVAHFVFAGRYAEFSYMFSVLLFGGTLQLMLRPVAVQVRIIGDNSIFYHSAIVVVLVIIPIIVLTAWNEQLYWTIMVSMLAPSSLLVAYGHQMAMRRWLL